MAVVPVVGVGRRGCVLVVVVAVRETERVLRGLCETPKEGRLGYVIAKV
jgi:hypothetical protein